ncbi:hypothetical protein Tco_0529233 [Tanacetum coccineum]
MFIVHGCVVSWKATLQHVVALSTIEVEYMALMEAIKESIWIKRLLIELGVNLRSVVVNCDNQSAIHLSRNAMFHERTKHINMRYHFIREIVESKEIEVAKIGMKDNTANAFTKVVPGCRLKVLPVLNTFRDLALCDQTSDRCRNRPTTHNRGEHLIRRFARRGNKPAPRDVKIASIKQLIQELEFPQLQQDAPVEEAEIESNETESEPIIWDIGDEEEEYPFVNKNPSFQEEAIVLVEEESCPVYDTDNEEEESMPVYDTDIEDIIEEECNPCLFLF